jgi:tight adherence protein B
MTLQWAAGILLAAAIVSVGRPPRAVRLSAPTPPTGRTVGWLLAVIAGTAVVGLAVSPVVVALTIIAAAVTHRVSRGHRAARRREEAAAAVVEVTYALAAELRAGRTSAEALLAVADVAGPLAAAVHAAHAAAVVGADAAAELAAAATMPGAERLRPVAAAWAVATAAGGQVAVVLERLSAAMDDEAELHRELEAALAGPRATMFLLAGLPVVGLLLGQSVGAHPVQLLVHRPLGWGLLAGAAVLDAAGVAIMRVIVTRSQAP